jgi:glucose-6-phosphate-specific signal transduction histidine kinase
LKDAKSPPATGAEGATLVAHLQQRREQERSRLSRMLHRDVSGTLAAARMDLSRIAGRVTDEEVQEQVRRVDHLLDQVIRDARREMQRLHPALLDHFGLPSAIRHLVEETCRARNVRYTVTLDETLDGVRPEILIATFRLVETLLGDGSEVPGIVEFTARLAARREGYVLELSRVPSERSPDSGDDVRADDLGALRTWLRTLGVTWLESSQGERLVVELRIPRPVKAAVSETPAG